MRRFSIRGMSMAPGLAPGDCLLVRRLHRPRRGDIVLFPHPARDDFWLVKRVVGLPGETVEIADGDVHIDGSPDRWSTDPTFPDGKWDVPDGHVFVLSDARHRTRADSRTFGPVPTDRMYVSVFSYRRGRRRPL